MRWHSTSESARNGEPSVVGACIAPFLLLRTDESCVRVLRWLDSFAGADPTRITDSFGILALPITSVVFRMASTVVEIFSHMLIAVRSIPEEELATLPPDGASEHDHYLYGLPKRSA